MSKEELQKAEEELHSSYDHKPRRGRPPNPDPDKMRRARHFIEDLKNDKHEKDIYGE